MIERIGRIVVLVRDYAEAIAFYRDVLGMAVLFDVEVGSDERFVHLGPVGGDGGGVWLRLARGDDQRALVGRQTGGAPLGVLYTADCRATVAGLAARGAALRGQPIEHAGTVVGHVADLYGNEWVLVQLPSGAA